MKKFILVLSFFCSCILANAGTTYLQLTCLIEGYHIGGGVMTPAAYTQGCAWAVPGLSDRVQVQLRNASAPYDIVGTAVGLLYTNGITNVIPITHSKLNSGSYYVVVKNTRNGVAIWSSTPINFTLGQTTSYDFTRDPSKTYGNNVKKVGGVATGYPLGVFAMYSGDVNQDGNIDIIDENLMEYAITHFLTGCVTTDLNGDANVDILDQAIFESNNPSLFIGVKRP